jgi:hypothetical protein
VRRQRRGGGQCSDHIIGGHATFVGQRRDVVCKARKQGAALCPLLPAAHWSFLLACEVY